MFLGFIGVTLLVIAAVMMREEELNSLKTLLSPVALVGAVVRQDSDPTKQTPLANVKVTAMSGSAEVSGESSASGLFSLSIRPRVYAGRVITLRFEHPDYKPLEIRTRMPVNQLFVIRLEPNVSEPVRILASGKEVSNGVAIKDARVRYLLKNHTTIGVGTLAKQFEVPNRGNQPCRGQETCSPDGKWRAVRNTLALEAEARNEFQNIRVSCIAGPCPFTKVETDELTKPARKIKVTVLNWSDTADFLVEADVTRTTVTDTVRYSYPFIVNETMNFSLPPDSEGPSIEANFGGQMIVSPLGPDLLVSWATCSVQVPSNGNKLFRCVLKPGYEFVQ